MSLKRKGLDLEKFNGSNNKQYKKKIIKLFIESEKFRNNRE